MNGKLPTKKAKWNGGNQTIRYRIQNNGYKDAQGTHRQLQGTEWELQQYEKWNRNYKVEKGRNEEYNIWNFKKITQEGITSIWLSRGPN